MKSIVFSVVIALAPWRDAEIIDHIKNAHQEKGEIEIILEKGLNVPVNRNNGVKKAKGKYVIFLDDDGKIEKDFFIKVKDFIKRYPYIDIFGGPQLTPEDDSLFAKANRLVMAEGSVCPSINNRYKKNPLSLNANSNFLSGALFICKRSIFKQILFNPKQYPADEVSFIDEAKEKGFRIGYSPEIYIFHRGRKELIGYIKQIFYFGNSRARKERISGLVKRPLFFVPAAFLIYSVLLLSFLLASAFTQSYLIFIFAPLIVYALVYFLISAKVSFQNKNPILIIILPFIIFITHLAYGAGSIYGLISSRQHEGI